MCQQFNLIKVPIHSFIHSASLAVQKSKKPQKLKNFDLTLTKSWLSKFFKYSLVHLGLSQVADGKGLY